MNKISNELPILSMTKSVSAKNVWGGCHEECHCHDECTDHDDCHCIQSVVRGTATCFWELRRLSHEVFRCLGCRPSESRLSAVFTCLILEDINNMFKEITAIKNQLCFMEHRTIPTENFNPNLTSGKVFVTNSQTAKVRVAVLNNTAAPQTVRVRVLDSSASQHALLNDSLLGVNSGCSSLIIQPLGNASSYEIQVFNLVPGMTVSSVEETSSGSFIDGTKLVATAFIANLGVCP